MEPVLRIESLTVGYRVKGDWRKAVRDVSLEIQAGQTYGLVGESGSGKTTLALAVMRYLPRNGRVLSGSIEFDGRDLLALDEREMRTLWGAEMALVPQDPQPSLNPSLRIGDQLQEILVHHSRLDRSTARRRSLELLEMVRLGDAERVAGSYPHELSGGMQQRALIAMALSTEPKLLVLDEPTTGLDTTTQAAILDLLRELMRDRRTAALYVTHNLGVVAQVCQRTAVFYAGELAEDGPTVDLFDRPLHPYTQGLLDSVPRLGEKKSQVKLRPIEGRVPSLDDLPGGCVFRPRCPLAIEVCRRYPPLYRTAADRRARCHRWEEIGPGIVSARQPEPGLAGAGGPDGRQPAVLQAEALRVHYRPRSGLVEGLLGRRHPPLKAVDGLDLEVPAGRTVGLVGESGSGKTTLARAIVGLVAPTEGRIRLFERELPARLEDREMETLRHLQIVFQKPDEALNPYLTVGQTLQRPLERMLGLPAGEARRRVARLLEAVHLSPDYAGRLPAQLSGGEKQRVAIARAFASQPDLLVADEPVSWLDVSVQASILNLLNELQLEEGGAYLFISHDLAVVGYLSDVVAVIYLGRLMEVAGPGELFEPPYHPYTEALLSAIPLIDPRARQERIRPEGEVPSPTAAPSGCPFHTRCPRFLGRVCVEEEPPWRTTPTGKRYYCHIPVDELERQQRRVFRFSGQDRPE